MNKFSESGVMIKLFGLLHLRDGQLSAMNVRVENFSEQISIYVRNALVLSRSLRSQGISFILLTNNAEMVRKHISDDQSDLIVQEISFSTQVPDGIRFYSAHFKLDAFKYLSTLSGYVGLCDLDMVCVSALPLCLINMVKAGIPLCYDISDQVIQAYGHKVIIDDLKLIHGIESEGRWYGGEYISGRPEFFRDLAQEVENNYKNYINNISTLHHVGDEAYTTAAIEVLKRDHKWYIGDVGTLGIVSRFWSTRVLHAQRGFSHSRKCFLLHLPADKYFINKFSSRQKSSMSFNVNDFLKAYKIYRYCKIPGNLARQIRDLIRCNYRL